MSSTLIIEGHVIYEIGTRIQVSVLVVKHLSFLFNLKVFKYILIIILNIHHIVMWDYFCCGQESSWL